MLLDLGGLGFLLGGIFGLVADAVVLRLISRILCRGVERRGLSLLLIKLLFLLGLSLLLVFDRLLDGLLFS